MSDVVDKLIKDVGNSINKTSKHTAKLQNILDERKKMQQEVSKLEYQIRKLQSEYFQTEAKLKFTSYNKGNEIAQGSYQKSIGDLTVKMKHTVKVENWYDRMDGEPMKKTHGEYIVAEVRNNKKNEYLSMKLRTNNWEEDMRFFIDNAVKYFGGDNG